MCDEELGVFPLLSALCGHVAREPDGGGSRPRLARKMRSRAYEILLYRGTEATPRAPAYISPISDLLSCYYVRSHSVCSLADRRASRDLIALVETIREKQVCEAGNDFERSLRLLVALKDEAPIDSSTKVFQPFTFGLLDELLPRLPREEFGSPLPYQYYPPHLFELPFSISRQDLRPSKTQSIYTEYTVDSFLAKSCQLRSQCTVEGRELKPFQLPTSLTSQLTSGLSIYSNDKIMDLPRLLAPRDLRIPKSEPILYTVLERASSTQLEVEEMFRAAPSAAACGDNRSLDIWELASSIDKNVPDDIWDIASKLPDVEGRRLIATSPREMSLWRDVYRDRLGNMHIVSEKQFIRHLMYLTIGIESASFPWSMEHGTFAMRSGLALEGVSRESVQGYTAGLLSTGTCYRRLYAFASNDYRQQPYGDGYIFEAAKSVVRRFLLKFRLKATEIYEECFSCNATDETNRLPTLLQIMYHLQPLQYEIETVASIYKVIDSDGSVRMPRGAGLMSYLYSEISLITHASTARSMFRSLYSICMVYFKFIERFIFQGELEDRHEEFFIRKDLQYVHSHSKRYWDRGFYMVDSAAVPHFLRGLARHILLCGKSFRLLKLCNPSDPLVLLISSDHPSIKCCTSFDQIERQRRLLNVYRTRCLFVSGEPVTFDQIMLKKEAERKAFTEMASIKQTETLDKIVAERKRLAQLIIAEKQHNLRVLEAAIAETKATRRRAKRRDSVRGRLERAVERAHDEADTILRDEEKNKMLEYYSKLNQEVEKRKAHTEWKIKRLQLDPERMQLLSTEERNLKREKFELELLKNDDSSCSNSIYSDSMTVVQDQISDEVLSDALMWETEDDHAVAVDDNATTPPKIDMTKGSVKTDKTSIEKPILDSQGNVIPTILLNEDVLRLNAPIRAQNDDNSEFIKIRCQALKNKQKVLAHELGQVDSENNITSIGDVLAVNTDKSETASKLFDSQNNVNLIDEQKQYVGCNEAFIEAKRNKNRVLGTVNDNITSLHKSQSTEFILQAESRDNFSCNDAQAEARRNKFKILGTYDDNYKIIRASQSTERLDNNETSVAFTEATRNRQRILGTDSDNPIILNRSHSIDYLTEAQKEALLNKQKVLGTEYHLEIKSSSREPLNVAQEDAATNKKKILNSEYGSAISNTSKGDVNRRASLKLDLKKPDEAIRTQENILLGITPTTGGLTPGDFFSQLDLETPTTGEVPFSGLPIAELQSPNHNSESIFNVSKHLSDNGVMSTDGFKFPSVMLEEENVQISSDAVAAVNIEESPSDSVLDLHLNKHFDCIKSSIWNLDDRAYNFESFDPFGVKGATLATRDHLSVKMDLAMKKSCYSNPADLIREMQKKPYSDIFSNYSTAEDEPESTLEDVDIANLSACFQRSVLLPLTYQLEMVNNSILTHYLVHLDMYEHLRSLKDYFFLMDGEFSRTICQNLFQKLVKTVSPEELLNFATLHSILDKALGSSIASVSKFSEKLSFAISSPPLVWQHSSPDVLQCLSLTYSVRWPMNMVLSAEALARYAKLFQFLLKMRRISWMLGQDFEVLKLSVKLSRDSRELLRSPQYNSVQLYRHVMASLVRALDNYIVTTCIHSSWTEFEADLKKARTLDDLHDCHVVYIKKVLFRCLLNKRSAPVMKLLNDVFTVILKFSHVLATRPWTKNEATGHFTNACFAQLQELYHLFEKLTRHLHKTIARLMECGYQPHLVELLTMVNLNGYYDPVAKSPDNSLNITQ